MLTVRAAVVMDDYRKRPVSLHALPFDVEHLMEVLSVTEVPIIGGNRTMMYCLVRHVETGAEYQDTSTASRHWKPGTRFTSRWDSYKLFPTLTLVE